MRASSRSVRNYRIALVVFTLLTLAFLGFVILAYGRLPERVPMHFDFAGNADRFGSRKEFLIVNLGMGILLYVCFGIFAMVMGKIPTRFFNLPNRDYWLAPERKEQSVAELNVYYIWMGTATTVLMFYVAWGVYETGIGAAETLPFGLWELGAYFAVMTVLCVILCYRFMRKPE